MKRLRSLAMMAALLLSATSQASAQKSDEAAIKKVLNQETTAYFKANYADWANTWVHDTADFILHAGANNFQELRGWNAISKEYQQDIKNMTPLNDADMATYLNKYDYQFYINGNLATVRFKEGTKNPDNTETRTLLKQNGSWKILNYVLINGGSYAMQDIMNTMKKLVGKWELDGKATAEPSRAAELSSVIFEMKETSNGWEQLSTFASTYQGQQYVSPTSYEYFIPNYNTNTIYYTVIEKNRSGQTFPGTGIISSDKPNSFTVTQMYPDKPTAIQTEYTVTLEKGKWHQTGKSYDREGKQIWTGTMDLRRVIKQ